ENKGETAAEVRRERTILALKKDDPLKPHEKAVVKLLFGENREVDLDKLGKDLEVAAAAMSPGTLEQHVEARLRDFKEGIAGILAKKNLGGVEGDHGMRDGLAFMCMFVGWGLMLIMACGIISAMQFHLAEGETSNAVLLVISPFAALAAFTACCVNFIR